MIGQDQKGKSNHLSSTETKKQQVDTLTICLLGNLNPSLLLMWVATNHRDRQSSDHTCTSSRAGGVAMVTQTPISP